MEVNSLVFYPIIPLPVEVESHPGMFTLAVETVICADDVNRANAEYLHNLMHLPTGLSLPIAPLESMPRNAIHLVSSAKDVQLGREGYQLTITPEAVRIAAPSPVGVFYGIQSLRQLLPASIERGEFIAGMAWRIPCLVIRDWPRFAWRGFMLDEGRHFHGRRTVMNILDWMALHKLNLLHWHLTDDQGWRIEITHYPRLTQVGAWRQGTASGFTGDHDGLPHGGFYTQEEIREVVAYAVARNITIVPEIEMPGHSLAALASYPEYSCTGGPFQVACRFGIHQDIYCAGKDETFIFLQDVLDEVMRLFPSQFIHIGGDEVPKRRWKECPACRRRIQQQGLKDEHALQVYFTNRIAKYLAAHERRLVGWNEILSPGLEPDAVPQYWVRDRKAVVAALHGGRQAVISMYLFAYLDHSYSLTPLSKAYRFEPVFHDLDEEAACNVLGLEGLLWTEFVPNRARLDYQVFPRLTAFAETGWTPKEKKDFLDFKKRLEVFQHRLDELGIRYARGADVEPAWYKKLFGVFTIPQPQTKTTA